MQTIEPGDYVVSDCGPLGAYYSVSEYEGKHLGTFRSRKAVCRFIRERMDNEQFWPNMFYVNDHGNIMQVSLKRPAIAIATSR
jgi:hypothetical protein